METKQTATIEDFVAQHGITMTYHMVGANPHMSDMPYGSRHYKFTLTRADKNMTAFYSQGPGIKEHPKLVNVLDCLAADADTVADAASFRDWAQSLGYSPDNIRAERTYLIVRKQTEKLRAFLGEDAFRDLLHNVERM